MIEILKAKLQELNNLSQSLNDQLEQLRQQLNERPPRYFVESVIDTSSDSEDDFVDIMSVETNEDSFADSLSNHSDGNAAVNNDAGNDAPAPANDNGENNAAIAIEGADVVEQVERTVVNSLFELSSRLELVRNQMRAVLNSGHVEEQSGLNDEVRIHADALEALVNTGRTLNHFIGNRNTDTVNNSNNTNNNVEDDGNHSVHSAASEVPESDIPSPASSSHSHRLELNSLSSISPYHTPVNRSPTSSMEFVHSPLPHFNGYESDEGDNQFHVVLTQPPESPSVSTASSSDLSSLAGDMNNDLSSIPTITSPMHENSDGFITGTVSPVSSPPRSIASSRSSLGLPRDLDHHSNMNSPRSSVGSLNSLWTSPCSDNGDDSDARYCRSVSYSPSKASAKSESDHSDNEVVDSEGLPDAHNEDADAPVHSGTDDSDQRAVVNDQRNAHLTSNSQERHQSPTHEYCNDQRFVTTGASDYHPLNASEPPVSYTNNNVTQDQKRNSKTSTVPYHNTSGESDVEHSVEVYENNGHDVTSNNKASKQSVYRMSIAALDNQVSQCEPDSTQELPTVPRTSTSGSASSTPAAYRIFTDSSDSDDSDSMKYITKRLRKGSRRDRNRSYMETCPSLEVYGRSHDSGLGTETSSQRPIRSRYSDFTERKKRKSEKDPNLGCSDSKKRRHDDQGNKATSKKNDPVESKPRSHRNDPTYKRNSGRSSKRTSTIQSDSISQEPNGQSLNVKIDLSLINYSGPLPPDSGSHTAPATRGLRSANISSYNSSSRQSRQTYRGSSVSAGEPSQPSGTTNSVSQKHSSRHTSSRSDNTNSTTSKTTSNPDVGSYDHDSDMLVLYGAEDAGSSDDTWQPGSNPESDISFSDGEAFDTDSSYEVQVPKSTAALLDEYASDSSDPTWTFGMS